MNPWAKLGDPAPAALTPARLACHNALQLLTHVARGYVSEEADDSHTSLTWDHELEAFSGRLVNAARPFSLALCPSSLSLLWLAGGGQGEAAFYLSGKTQSEAIHWVEANLAAHGLPVEPFRRPLHFEVETYPPAGTAYEEDERGPLRELANYYANAANLFQHLAPNQPVRCWPHHFDIAALIPVAGAPGRTIGLGMSPGDSNYAQPYFYVTSGPALEPARLPGLMHGGHWHTQGWTGVVVLSEDIARIDSGEDQAAWVRQIVSCAADDLKALLSAA
ncbi:MAG: hypothetical protein ABI693_01900 [Bryobacteraceae bacterium]